MVVKQPDKTRQTILEAALWEIYRAGYKAASVDKILEGTGLTKGALYHHFPNKLALGYAVVDEVLRPWILRHWLEPFEQIENPVDALQVGVHKMVTELPEEWIHGGCPLNNLIQEMSAVDEGFRVRLERILDEWRKGVARQLRRGQEQGYVRTDLDPDATAAYLVSSFEGIAGSGKVKKSREFALQLVRVFCALIETLRPAGKNIPEAAAAS